MKTSNWIMLVSALFIAAGCSSSRPYTEESIIQAQRDYNARNTPTPTATSTNVPVQPPAPAVAPVSDQAYRSLNTLHWVGSVLAAGDRIKLEDGSIWEISPGDTMKTKFWIVANKLSIIKGINPQYPIRITNTDKNETVDARIVSQ